MSYATLNNAATQTKPAEKVAPKDTSRQLKKLWKRLERKRDRVAECILCFLIIQAEYFERFQRLGEKSKIDMR